MANSIYITRQDKAQRDNPIIDLGTIQEDMSLLPDGYQWPILAKDYLISRSVAYNPEEPLTETYFDGVHAQVGGTGEHVNKVKLPKKMYKIMPGDRVVLAWVANVAVVIDLVYTGTEAL